MTDLENIVASHVVDARGSACPGPLLETKKAIGKVKVGEILEIQSSDLGTREDVKSWSKFAGHEYFGMLEDDGGFDRHFLKRGK